MAAAEPPTAGANEFEAQYKTLRRKLIIYFARKESPADELADETLYRVAVAVAKGHIVNLGAFSYGVAKNVYADWLRELRVSAALSSPTSLSGSSSPKASCLRRCLQSLPDDRRELVEAYFLDDDRPELARRQGLTVNALRKQISRLKASLALCIEKCTGSKMSRHELT